MKLKVFFAICLLGIFAIGAPASASDRTVYSGSSCEAYYGYQGDSLYRYDGGIYNSSGSGMWISCPIARMHTTTTSGLWEGRVDFYRSSSATSDLTCILKSRHQTSQHIKSNSNDSSNSAADFMYLFMDYSFPGGYYQLVCYLPEYSQIHSYAIEEKIR